MLFTLPLIHKNFIRGLLGIINGLCILMSLLIMVFVVYDEGALKQYGGNTNEEVTDGNEMLIFAASVMLYAAIIGFFSAVNDNYKLLHEYICILILMLALTLPISVYVFIQRAKLDLKSHIWLHEQFHNVSGYTTDGPILTPNYWDKIQDKYECCGFGGPSDYILLQKPLSVSCCPSAYRAKSKFLRKVLYNRCIITSSFVRDGCESKLQKSLQYDRYLLVGIAILSFWFQLAGILTASCIANNLRKKALSNASNELSGS